MATAVLSARDCLGCHPPSEEHVISISRHGHGGRRRSQFLQTGAKSGKVSAHFFPNANTFEYASPRKAPGKSNPLSRNYVLAASPPDQKRPLKSKVPDDYQPEVLRTNVNSEARIYTKSCHGNNHIEGPKKGSMADGSKGGRSLVTGQVPILKRDQTVKDVKGVPKGANQLAPPAERVGEKLRILRSASDAVDVQFATDRESCGKGVAKEPDFHSEKWAGPAFVNSPSPSCLPFPKFSVKKSVEGMVQVDSSATRDLRQLLGLGKAG